MLGVCVGGGEDKDVKAGGAAPGVVPQELATFILRQSVSLARNLSSKLG